MLMVWDPIWDKMFKERATWGKYPPEELVRFISGYYSVQNRSSIKILEIGCGPGAGPSWFIAREGFSLYGMDGSATAIEKAKKRFHDEGLKGEFVEGQLNKIPWPGAFFDCVVDIACLQHNAEDDTRTILREVHRVLKPGGRHFSLTTKARCWGDGTGTRVDETSYRNVKEGPFSNMGVTRFATRESLVSLYSGFQELELNYSVRSVDNGSREISNWIITCNK